MTSASSNSDKSTKRYATKTISKNLLSNLYKKTTPSLPNSDNQHNNKSPHKKKSPNLGSETIIIKNSCSKPKNKNQTSGPNSRLKQNKKASISENPEPKKSTPPCPKSIQNCPKPNLEI